ncbi:MAG: NAD(P)/FAD-dependent oxidoreductase [Pyrinomonadaceae bacterium]
MANILILGGGFAGLVTAERLAASVDDSHQITLVAPNKKFIFYPGLVQLAFGKCSPEDITFDLSAKLSNLGVRYVQGEMIRIHDKRRKVEIAGDDFRGEIAYDYLVIALGRRLATERVSGFFENAQHLLGVKAAVKFGELVRTFREGTIIVGLCPDARLPVPVCETAFALAKKFEDEVRDGKIQIKVVLPESLEAAFGGANLHKELEAAFKRSGINVLYDVPIREISFNEVISTQKHKIKCDLLMLVPPFRGNASLSELDITDSEYFVKVDERMRVHGLQSTYAVGDIVAFSGPKLAHMAVRQAEVAAKNIIAEVKGEEPDEVYYHEIATIIDAAGPDSLYLHYGIWDDAMYRLKKGRFWGWAKHTHDALWRTRHR